MVVTKEQMQTAKARYMVRTQSVTYDRRRRRIRWHAFQRNEPHMRSEGNHRTRTRGTPLEPDRTTVAELLMKWLATKKGEITSQSHAD